MGDISFDDLIPQGKGQATSTDVSFDDLVPKQDPQVGGLANALNPKRAAQGLAALASGAATGAVSLPGDIVSLVNLARKGYSALTGGNYDPSKDDYSLGQGYKNLVQNVDNAYQPSDPALQDLKTAGGYIPALVGGPESIATKALTRIAAPAAASKLASDLTGGNEYATAAAGLLAGLKGVKGSKGIATSEDVQNVVNKNYSDFRAAPVTLDPSVTQNWATQVQRELALRGLDNQATYNMLTPVAKGNTPLTPTRLQQLHEDLNGEASSGSSAGTAGQIAKTRLQQFMNTLQPSDAVTGGQFVPQMVADWNTGRNNALVQHQLAALEGKAYKAQQQANSTYSGDNVDNKFRQQIASLLTNEQAMNRLEPYRADMEAIVNGTPTLNGIRRVGNLLGGHNNFLAPLLIGGAFSGFGEPLAGLGVAGAIAGGTAALRRAEGAITKSRLDTLLKKVGSNAQGVTPPPAFNPWLTRGMITALSQNQNQGQ